MGNTRWALPSAGQAILARQNRAASAKQTRAQADALLFQTPSDDCRRRAAALQARQLTCRAGARKARNAADAVRQASQAANTRTEGHLSPLRPGPAPITAARQRRVCCPSPKHGAEVRAPRAPPRLLRLPLLGYERSPYRRMALIPQRRKAWSQSSLQSGDNVTVSTGLAELRPRIKARPRDHQERPIEPVKEAHYNYLKIQWWPHVRPTR